MGIERVPLLAMLSAVLLSTPVLLEMERGNSDVLVLLMVCCAALLLRAPGRMREVAAGLLLAIGAWVKLYPGLLLVALIALRRWRLSSRRTSRALSLWASWSGT